MKQRQANLLEVIAPGQFCSVWSLSAADKMEQVVSDGYLTKRFAAFGLRKNDRVMVTADINSDKPSHAWLVIRDVASRGVSKGAITAERMP